MPCFSPQRLIPALSAFPDARRCWIAYSGGLDSEALLHAAAALRSRLGPELRAIHVDHGLHPGSAAWAGHCRRHCADLFVPLTVHRLSLGRIRGKSLEALAREARYRALRESLGPGDLLLTAQHRDDQAETLLLALMRGSGVKGLSAMPVAAPFGDAWLLRPLLDWTRAELLAYARGEGLVWVDDPSNLDVAFDRNFLRARVLPLLAERWPGYAASLARTASHCAEAQDLVDRLAGRGLDKVAGSRPGTVSVAGLRAGDPSEVGAILRHWIAGQGLPRPDSRHLARIQDEALRARPDRSPLVAWAGCEVRRYRDDLFAMQPLPPLPGPGAIDWMAGDPPLPETLGRLALLDPQGRTLEPGELHPGGLSVRFGVHGLTCRPDRRGHRKSLKGLFQEAGVPPWLRAYVPLVFKAETLAAVGDLWVCGGEDGAAMPSISWEGGIRGHPGFPMAIGGKEHT